MSRTSICLDFDGVIHSYTSGWTSADEISDPPVKGAFEFIQELLDNDFQVFVFSSRSHQLDGLEAIKKWFTDWGYPQDDNNQPKGLEFPRFKPPAIVYIDDRAVQFRGNFEELDPEELRNFRPWNK